MIDFFCPITYSRKFRKIKTIKDFPIYMGVSKYKNFKFSNLNWWINTDSGNIQIYPKIDLQSLYFKSHGSGTIGKTWEDHHEQFFLILKKYLVGNICEIGGGSNSVLKKIKNFSNIKSFYCFDKNLSFKKNNSKIKTIHSFFDEKNLNKIRNPKFDLILHSHTFEHLYNPEKFLKLIKHSMTKKGMHIFSIPNMHQMVKKGYANAMNFEHPFYFDEKLIDHLLKKNGFKILKKKYFKIDHSIMYVTRVSSEMTNIKYSFYEKNLKLFTKMFNNWSKDIDNINKKIANKNNKIFIFGAHIFSQLLIFNGIRRKAIYGILDNDKNKINKFLYGTSYKIYNPEILKTIKDPIIVLRAGVYNDEIKKQILKLNRKSKII